MKLDKNHIFRELELETADEYFEFVGEKLLSEGFVKETYVEALKNREKEFPTGLNLPIGVAIPHTDADYVKKNTYIVSTFKNPIIFNEMGGEPDSEVNVKLAINIVMNDGNKHLEALQSLISKIQEESFVESVVNANSDEEIQELFKNI